MGNQQAGARAPEFKKFVIGEPLALPDQGQAAFRNFTVGEPIGAAEARPEFKNFEIGEPVSLDQSPAGPPPEPEPVSGVEPAAGLDFTALPGVKNKLEEEKFWRTSPLIGTAVELAEQRGWKPDSPETMRLMDQAAGGHDFSQELALSKLDPRARAWVESLPAEQQAEGLVQAQGLQKPAELLDPVNVAVDLGTGLASAPLRRAADALTRKALPRVADWVGLEEAAEGGVKQVVGDVARQMGRESWRDPLYGLASSGAVDAVNQVTQNWITSTLAALGGPVAAQIGTQGLRRGLSELLQDMAARGVNPVEVSPEKAAEELTRLFKEGGLREPTRTGGNESKLESDLLSLEKARSGLRATSYDGLGVAQTSETANRNLPLGDQPGRAALSSIESPTASGRVPPESLSGAQAEGFKGQPGGTITPHISDDLPHGASRPAKTDFPASPADPQNLLVDGAGVKGLEVVSQPGGSAIPHISKDPSHGMSPTATADLPASPADLQKVPVDGAEVKGRYDGVNAARYDPTPGIRLHEATTDYLRSQDVDRFLEKIPSTGGLKPTEVRRADPEGAKEFAEVATATGTKPAVRMSGGHALETFAARIKDLPDLKRGSGGQGLDTQRLHEMAGGGRVQDNPVVEHLLRPAQDGLLAQQTYYNQRAGELSEILEKTLDTLPFWVRRRSRENAGKVADVLGPEWLNRSPAEILAKHGHVRSILEGIPAERAEKVIGAALGVRRWMDKTRLEANQVRRAMGRDEIGYMDKYLPRVRKPSMVERITGYPDSERKAKVGDGDGAGVPDFVHPNAPSNPRAESRTAEQAVWNQEFDLVKAATNHLEMMSREMFRTPLVDHYKAHVQVMKDQGKANMAENIERWADEVLAGKKPWLTAQLDKAGPLVQAGRHQVRRVSRGLKKSVFVMNPGFILFRQTSSSALTVARYGVRNSMKAMVEMFRPEVKELAESSYHRHMKKGTGAALSVDGDQVQTLGIGTPRNLDKRTFMGRWADWTVEAMEEVLSRHAHAAALLDGAKRLKLTGRDLADYASSAMGKTQSMYNPEDVPGLLRNKDLTAVVPFQTFYFELMNNVREMGVRMPTNEALKSQRLKTLARFIGAATAFNILSEEFWGDKSYDFTNPLGYLPFVGPLAGSTGRTPGRGGWKPIPVQYYDDFEAGVKELIETGELNKLRKWGLRYHVKGGTQLNRTWEGLIASLEGEVKDKRGRTKFTVEGPSEVIRALTLGNWKTEAGKEYLDKRDTRSRSIWRGIRYQRNLEANLIKGQGADLDGLKYLTKARMQAVLKSWGETSGLWKKKAILEERIRAGYKARFGGGE